VPVIADGVIEAVAERAGDGWTIRAPRVGVYRGGPRSGRLRAGGDEVGTLTVLNHTLALVLPSEAGGLVTGASLAGRAAAVEYGQPLFSLAARFPSAKGRGAVSPSDSDPSPPEGSHGMPSPIDGVFYRCPSPGADPFVRKGDIIALGRTIGLIEAMKSFNAVTYDGPGLPPRARVVEIKAADASEVRQGAVLLIVEPA